MGWYILNILLHKHVANYYFYLLSCQRIGLFEELESPKPSCILCGRLFVEAF